MEDDSEINTCSFSNNSDTGSVNHTQNKINIDQNIAVQNEYLQEVNERLQKSNDSLKQQLKEALEASKITNTLSDQVIKLKEQLIQAQNKKENDASRLQAIQTDHKNEVTGLLEKIRAHQAMIEENVWKIKNLEEHNQRLKKDKVTMKSLMDDKDNIIEAFTKEIEKIKINKRKLKAKNVELLDQLSRANARIEEMNIQLETVKTETTQYKGIVDELTFKLNTANAFNDEAKSSYENTKSYISVRDTIISTLESQLDSQRKEFEEFGDIRDKLIHVIQRSHKGISSSELMITNLLSEISDLKVKLRAVSNSTQKISPMINQNNLLDLKIPFEGETHDKCEDIMKLPHYQPMQKVQLILNEAASSLAASDKKLIEMRKSLEEMNERVIKHRSDEDKYRGILCSFIQELKESIAIDSTPMGEIVAEKCYSFDPLITSIAAKEFPNDFYAISSIEDRNRILKSLVDNDGPASALLHSFLLLINMLKKKNNEMNQSITELHELQANNQNNGEMHTKAVKYLQEKIDKLKHSGQLLRQALKSAQKEAEKPTKSDNSTKFKHMQLQIQIDTLQNENDVLKVKLQVIQNELNLKTKELNNLINNQQSVQQQPSFSQLINEEKFEKILQQKNEEIDRLIYENKKLRDALEEVTKRNHKRNKSLIDHLRGKIDELQEEKYTLENEYVYKNKKLKKSIKQTKEQYESTINDISSSYQQSRQMFDETVRILTEKANEARHMSEGLIFSLTECEQKNQKLQSENQDLIRLQKELNIKLNCAKQQISKERQQSQAILTAQTLGSEAKLQDASLQIKSQYEKRISEIMSAVIHAFGDLYGLDENTFNEEAFQQLVSCIKADLLKLRYFQEETTKYKPSV